MTIAWHQLDAAETLRHFASSADAGLSEEEARRRLTQYGANQLTESRSISPAAILLAQFKNALILILLAAVALSAFLGHTIEALAIALIILFAALLGFYQEFRAERAIETLRKMAAPTAVVRRGGAELEVPAQQVVPGDIMVLRMGDRVAGDGRLFDVANLQGDEAVLTGESVPVPKQTEALESAELPVAERTNLVYAGTSITYGRGRALVVATGMQTEFGKIADMLQSVEPSRTPLQQNLDKLGEVLARAALLIVTMIGALGWLRGQPLLEMIIFGIALAVAVVPEALPAVVTISLAIGVQSMVRRNALIRRLSAVETLGSVSVICSDKTGTLTKNEMTVRKILVKEKIFTVSGAGYAPEGAFSDRSGGTVTPDEPLKLLLRAAALASDVQLVRRSDHGWKITGDPTEGALVVAAAKAGLDKNELEMKFPRVGEIPFTSESKRMTTVHAVEGSAVAYAKGAPEVILNACTGTQCNGRIAPLDRAARDSILQVARQLADEALRVIAVAHKPGAKVGDAEHDMIFLGLLGMIDPPRPEAKAAIETCARAGIKPMMITGDHPSTAMAVARELGLVTDGRVITGTALDAISDAELEAEVPALSVIARVSPAHKLRIVTALQNSGHFVAMTGDGVNDAPALKKANIGVAMGISGTDVTKEAADMTLTDDNFASIVAAVEEGRAVFANIKKYLMFLLSCNLGEIVLLAVATVLAWPLPLTAVQILYINLVTDGLPALALAVDPHDPELMQRKPRDPRAGIFSFPVLLLMIAGGLWSALVNLGLFQWALNSGRSLEQAMTMVFVALVLIEFFKAYNYRSDRHSCLRQTFANRWLNLAIGSEMLLLPLIIYLPFFQHAMNTFGLSLQDWFAVLALALTIFPVLEGVKFLVRRGWFGRLE